VVFSDLLCEQCRILNRHLDIVAANHRGEARIEYRHYPMDASCRPELGSSLHPGACALARAAACAARQGRFWAFVDAVHGGGPVQPERIELYARRAGLDLEAFRACRNHPASLKDVRRDIRLADSLGITSTPTTFLNGRALVGAFKPWLWEEAILAIAP
jgi:protein-disulfide isomerase